MSAPLRGDMDLHPLFKKIGHHLEEIRVRALKNILAKIDHNILTDADLIHERHLLIRLLEWFNFPTCPMKTEVLKLLTRLSEHTSASEILLAVGGIEFFTQYRSTCDESEHPLIDTVMENMLRLPAMQHDMAGIECVYHGNSTADASEAHENQSNSTLMETTCSSQYSTMSTSDFYNHSQHGGHQMGYFMRDQSAIHDHKLVPPISYEVGPAHDHGHRAATYSGLSPCFKITTFPWLGLTPTDRHVLTSTNTSLQSREPSLLVSACEFLSDVVFQDFPAEVFIQRPSIVKSLLSLMSLPVEGPHCLPFYATQTLLDLAECLHTRVRFYHDPALYTPKYDLFSFTGNTSTFISTPSTTHMSSSNSIHSSDVRPPVIGQSDTRHHGDGGNDGTLTNSSRSLSGTSSFADTIWDEDTAALQFSQLTLPQFCVLCLEKLLPLLGHTEESLVIKGLLLLGKLTDLFSESITTAIWDDHSSAAVEVAEKLIDSFTTFGDLLHEHHHGKHWSEKNPHGHDIVQHRHVFIGLSTHLVRLLLALVPHMKTASILPDGLTSALPMILFDETLACSYPNVRRAVVGYVREADSLGYRVYEETVRICKSLAKTCKFLKDFDIKMSKKTEKLVKLAKECIPSIPYHGIMDVVSKCVQLVSHLCRKTACPQSREILLQLLSHPVKVVRVSGYTACDVLLQKCLCVDEAANPLSKANLEANFLLDTQVLYEIACFGLSADDKETSEISLKLMTKLLQSQLMLGRELWQSLLTELQPVLPILQGFVDIQTDLGRFMFGMLDGEQVLGPGALPILERLRGTLRLLLSPDLKVRSAVLKRLAYFLSHEPDHEQMLPVFSELPMSNLSNLLIVGTQRPQCDEPPGQSLFKSDSLRKVFEIFISPSLEHGVKKSALDQLANILQDAALHPYFLKDGGLEKILEILKLGVRKDHKTDYSPMLLPAVTILRHLCHHSFETREKVARDSTVYYAVLRTGLMYRRDENVLYEVSHLLTLLLFYELSSFSYSGTEMSSKQFSLPAACVARYKLPFKAATHNTTSPHQITVTPTPDPLMTGSPAEMLRISWLTAWHDNMLELIKSIRQNMDGFNHCLSKKLTPCSADYIIISCTHFTDCIHQCLYDISNATSHDAVRLALDEMSCYLVESQYHNGCDVLHQHDWVTILNRFLQILPSSTSDENLLLDLFNFIKLILELSTNEIPRHILEAVRDVLYDPKATLIGLLNRANINIEPADVLSVRRRLDKQLLSFISTFSHSHPYSLSNEVIEQGLRGTLIHKLMLRLNVADAPHFYNLASLEGTLHCLVYITTRPHWSEDCVDIDGYTLCSQLLNSLLEVISAFHVGRGSTAMSYMGKGVTKAATFCLRHLVYEMARIAGDKNWPASWVYNRQGDDAVGEPGFTWMLTLWADRDPEVRVAGLGIAVALAATEPGRIVVTNNCTPHPGGIWGVIFNILLDQAEASMVRQQAALLMVNMTAQSLPIENVADNPAMWQGPMVTDTHFEMSLYGLPALLALLHHSNFYQELIVILSNYYPQPRLHPISVVRGERMSANGSQSTLTTDTNLLTTLDMTGQASSLLSTPAGNASHQYTSTPTYDNVPLRTPDSRNVTPRTGAVGADQTSSTTTSGESYDYQSVTTPCFISAIAQLLSNLLMLAPQDTVSCLRRDTTIQSLLSLLDLDILEAYCSEVSNSPKPGPFDIALSDLLHMYSSITHLLKTSMETDRIFCVMVLEDNRTLKLIIQLLGVHFHGKSDTMQQLYDVYESVFTTLTTLLHVTGHSAYSDIVNQLGHQWTSVTDRCSQLLMKEGYGDRHLYISCLNLWSVLLAHEGRQLSKHISDGALRDLLDSEIQTDGGDGKSAGALFTGILVTAYEKLVFKPPGPASQSEKVSLTVMFQCLLSVSATAKEMALQAGLVENLIDHIKQIHVKLSMEAMDFKTASKKKDEDLREIVSLLDLLTNFMYQNLDVKVAAHHSGLASVLHNLWSWGLSDQPLLSALINILVTFTARCPQSATSLAYTSASSTAIPTVPGKPQLSSHSMVHCLIKYIQREIGQDSPRNIKTVFALLSTLVLSTECRNILWKSNLLHEFSSLHPGKTKKSKQTLVLDGLWLKLLINLSFCSDGQQMILKIKESISLLLEFIEATQPTSQESALLVTRNLCFHAANKPKLLAHEKFVPCLLQQMESGTDKGRLLAVSALWALVHNNQKAKVTLKNANIIPKLKSAMAASSQITSNNLRPYLDNLNSVYMAVVDGG